MDVEESQHNVSDSADTHSRDTFVVLSTIL